MNISDADLYALMKDFTILLIEDYEPFAKELEALFREFFKIVEVAYDGEEALLKYHSYKEKYGRYFDILITDICLPNKNGVEICRTVRNINKEQEIIVISAYTESEDLLKLINLGIRRFITKPIQYEELFSSLFDIGCLLDIRNENDTEYDHFVPLGETCHWNSEKNELLCNGEAVYCSAHELLLLKYLIKRRGTVCTAQSIIEFFYGYDIEISEKSIRNLILKLRQKTNKKCIENIYGLGYRLQAD